MDQRGKEYEERYYSDSRVREVTRQHETFNPVQGKADSSFNFPYSKCAQCLLYDQFIAVKVFSH